jgi:hypothetical protein
MHVRIVKPGDDSPPLEVDPSSFLIGSSEKFFSAAGGYAASGNGYGRDLGLGFVEGGDLAVMQKQVG